MSVAMRVRRWQRAQNLRSVALAPKAVRHWSLRSVQIKLIKIGAWVGAYRRAPCGTWIANILGVIGGDEGNLTKGGASGRSWK